MFRSKERVCDSPIQGIFKYLFVLDLSCLKYFIKYINLILPEERRDASFPNSFKSVIVLILFVKRSIQSPIHLSHLRAPFL